MIKLLVTEQSKQQEWKIILEIARNNGFPTHIIHTWCVRKVMTLNSWLDNWQRCSHTSDTSQDIRSYLMISASFNSIALTRVI